MSVDIGDEVMTSTTSAHTAASVEGGWSVSWLPGRVLARDQAITGMMFIDTVAAGLVPGDRRWPALDSWAHELGLSGPEAVVRASTTDEVRERIARAEAAQAADHLYGITDPVEKMGAHAEDEAIDFAQLPAAEQDRLMDDQIAYEDALAEGITQHALVSAIIDQATLDEAFVDPPIAEEPIAEDALNDHDDDVDETDDELDHELDDEDDLAVDDVDDELVGDPLVVGAAAMGAVAMPGPVETSAAGEAWSRRVDAAVQGIDALDPVGLDTWMAAHALSGQPHLNEAELVSAWESSRPVSGAEADQLLAEVDYTFHLDGTFSHARTDRHDDVGDDVGDDVSAGCEREDSAAFGD